MIANEIVGSTFHTEGYGDIVVLEYKDYYNVVIKFIETGTVATVRVDSVRDRSVVDYKKPVTYGVGFRGYGPFKTSTKSYSAWSSMLRRCYDNSYQEKYPTYIGCEVCEDWHNFQNFAEWYYFNIPEDMIGLRVEVDKDIKGSGKLYSPEACLVVSPSENIMEVGDRVHAKPYVLVDPKGIVKRGVNLSKFCRENNIDRSLMRKVINGKNSHHKGYTKHTVDKTNYRKEG